MSTGKAGSGWVSRDRRLTHESFSEWSPLSVSSCAPLTRLGNPLDCLTAALTWLYRQSPEQREKNKKKTSSPPMTLVCRGLKVFSRQCHSILTWQRRPANPGQSAVAYVNKQQANIQVTLTRTNTSPSFQPSPMKLCGKQTRKWIKTVIGLVNVAGRRAKTGYIWDDYLRGFPKLCLERLK